VLRGHAVVNHHVIVTVAIVNHHNVAVVVAVMHHHAISAVVNHDSVGPTVANDHALGNVVANDHALGSHDHAVRLGPHHEIGCGNVIGPRRRFLEDRRRWLDDHRLADHGDRARGRCRDCDRLEQRLAMPQSFQIQPVEAVPFPLENDQRAIVVPAPDFADLFAALVGDAELVLLLRRSRQVEADLDVQVLLGVGRSGSCLAAAANRIHFGNVGNVPGRGIVRSRRRLLR
jgi:hypothetical protein